MNLWILLILGLVFANSGDKTLREFGTGILALMGVGSLLFGVGILLAVGFCYVPALTAIALGGFGIPGVIWLIRFIRNWWAK